MVRTHLEAVLRELRKHKFYLNIKKCRFAQKEVEYLGNVVGGGQRKPSPTKVKAMLDHPEPRTSTELRAFLGIGNYLAPFIPKLAEMAAPSAKQLC